MNTQIELFQSTHSLRSATVIQLKKQFDKIRFNPRTPCGVRRDDSQAPASWDYVSIHALLAECDGTIHKPLPHGIMFQSTHSLRSATHTGAVETVIEQVSIHALLAECDVYATGRVASYCKFQSTHSLRSATPLASPRRKSQRVSIHALLAECDRYIPVCRLRFPGFNPRTPCGVRRFRDAPIPWV